MFTKNEDLTFIRPAFVRSFGANYVYISKHVSNPVYVITQNLRKNKCTQSYGNEASITCNINHNFYSGSDTIPIRPILQTTKLTVSIASKTIP